jgi:hypothetical protein
LGVYVWGMIKLGQQIKVNGIDCIVTGIFKDEISYRKICYYRDNLGAYIGSNKYTVTEKDELIIIS